LSAHFHVGGKLKALSVPLFVRDRLPVDQVINGPTIIVQKDTTIVIPPGANARSEAVGNLIIKTGFRS